MKQFHCFCLALVLALPLFGQSSYFPPLPEGEWETTLPAELDWNEDALNELIAFLDETNTKAFIVAVDGRMVIEEYFDEFIRDSLWYWASAGKSLAAVMLGIAQEEGHLELRQASSDFLGSGWTNTLMSQEDSISIYHQMTMTSGLADEISGCTEPSCLEYLTSPGERWSYQNGPYTLTHEVIREATQINFNLYTNLRLARIGLVGAWVPLGVNRVFFSTPRSMARFGLFALNKLNWDGWSPFSTEDYYNEMITPSQDLNKSYGYLWWLHGQESHMLPLLQLVFDGPLNPNIPADAYSALGKDGQFLDVVPSMNLVVVRMGDNPDNSLVPVRYHRDLWERINQVLPQSTSTQTVQPDYIKISPNPSHGLITISVQGKIPFPRIYLYDISGNLVHTQVWEEKEQDLLIQNLPAGTYHLSSGKSVIGKVVKQ